MQKVIDASSSYHILWGHEKTQARCFSSPWPFEVYTVEGDTVLPQKTFYSALGAKGAEWLAPRKWTAQWTPRHWCSCVWKCSPFSLAPKHASPPGKSVHGEGRAFDQLLAGCYQKGTGSKLPVWFPGNHSLASLSGCLGIVVQSPRPTSAPTSRGRGRGV